MPTRTALYQPPTLLRRLPVYLAIFPVVCRYFQYVLGSMNAVPPPSSTVPAASTSTAGPVHPAFTNAKLHAMAEDKRKEEEV